MAHGENDAKYNIIISVSNNYVADIIIIIYVCCINV